MNTDKHRLFIRIKNSNYKNLFVNMGVYWCLKILFFLIISCLSFSCVSSTEDKKRDGVQKEKDRSIQTQKPTKIPLEKFQPIGWNILKEIREDLNNDGLIDVVFLFEKGNSRLLKIIFADEKIGYKLSYSSKNLIKCRTCGGVINEPLQSFRVLEDKSILIHQYGGDTFRWSMTLKFLYQNKDWFVTFFQKSDFDTDGSEIDKVTSYDSVQTFVEISEYKYENGRGYKYKSKLIRQDKYIKLKSFKYSIFENI